MIIYPGDPCEGFRLSHVLYDREEVGGEEGFCCVHIIYHNMYER